MGGGGREVVSLFCPISYLLMPVLLLCIYMMQVTYGHLKNPLEHSRSLLVVGYRIFAVYCKNPVCITFLNRLLIKVLRTRY